MTPLPRCTFFACVFVGERYSKPRSPGRATGVGFGDDEMTMTSVAGSLDTADRGGCQGVFLPAGRYVSIATAAEMTGVPRWRLDRIARSGRHPRIFIHIPRCGFVVHLSALFSDFPAVFGTGADDDDRGRRARGD